MRTDPNAAPFAGTGSRGYPLAMPRKMASPSARDSLRQLLCSCRVERISGSDHAFPRLTPDHQRFCEELEHSLREHLSCSLEQIFCPWDSHPLRFENSALYPDFWISILSLNPVGDQRVAYPGVVIEVLSRNKSRAIFARKLNIYRSMPDVREILVIDIVAGRAQLYRRTGSRCWTLDDVETGTAVMLHTIDFELTPIPGMSGKKRRTRPGRSDH